MSLVLFSDVLCLIFACCLFGLIAAVPAN